MLFFLSKDVGESVSTLGGGGVVFSLISFHKSTFFFRIEKVTVVAWESFGWVVIWGRLK